jgi:hypothetical protein
MMTIIDDYSRKTWVFVTTVWSNLSDIFRGWQLQVEAESGHRVMAIRCDNTPELKKLHEWIKGHGGTMELAVSYGPEQNGVAEHMNRTIIEKTRTMLIDLGLPLCL